MLHFIYRLSDKSNDKEKLKNADKINCLKIFIRTFGKKNLIVFFDNCEQRTINEIKDLKINVVETNSGNSGSFMSALNFAVNNFNENDYVYFCEDDYFHKKSSKKILLEGLKISDYVTLYDHPDKYMENSPNPFVKNGGEISRVLLTKTCHWKTTNSTTMTFASKVKTLKEDYKIFEMFCQNPIPSDFSIFRILTGNFLNIKDKIIFDKFCVSKRTLISPIPSYSTHCEIKNLAPLINWEKF